MRERLYRRRRPNTRWGDREFDRRADDFDFPACGVADCFYCFSGLDLGVFEGCLDVAVVSLCHTGGFKVYEFVVSKKAFRSAWGREKP